MSKRADYDELLTALELFEKAAVPGGGGEIVALRACIDWENALHIYGNSLTTKQKIVFTNRAQVALSNALAPIR